MADQEIKEILSAYALGCMDKRNLDHFNEYLEIEGDLPYQLLSDYVNLSSLIPTILTIEKPNPKLKETVAKNLLSLHEEIKKKIKQKNLETAAKLEFKTTSYSTESDENNFEYVESRNDRMETEIESKALEESTNFAALSTRTTLFSPQDYERGTKEVEEYQEQRNSTSPFNLFNFILASVMLIILVVFGYYFYNMNKSLGIEVENLKARIAELNTDLVYSKDFISKYEKMIDFFNYTDISVIPLGGTEVSPNSVGRLFISQEGREALLEIKNLPILKNTDSYYLWIVSNQLSYVLTSFVPKTGERYISIPEFPRIPLEEVDLIILTNEPRAGSSTPQGSTFLYGSLKKEIKKK